MAEAGSSTPDGEERGRQLLALARQSIAAAVGAPAPATDGPVLAAGGLGSALATGGLGSALATGGLGSALATPGAASGDAGWLRAPGATFVTLTVDGRLRGCMGSIAPRRPLGEDVRGNARAAALSDPRFPPLTVAELEATRIEVSVLSAAVALPAAASEAAALAELRPGRDGVILEYHGDARATFLPQVWEDLPAPRDFLARLKEKAGLPPGFWSPDIRLAVYTVVHWQEPG